MKKKAYRKKYSPSKTKIPKIEIDDFNDGKKETKKKSGK